jgi:hypothetical protein
MLAISAELASVSSADKTRARLVVEGEGEKLPQGVQFISV